jgi:hypothetical protein
MLRGTALFGFILTGIGTQLPWFRWEMIISGREAIFEVSALDMADRGETILVFAVVGGTVVWFASRATPIIISVLAAAMSLVVVLYTYSNPLPDRRDGTAPGLLRDARRHRDRLCSVYGALPRKLQLVSLVRVHRTLRP